MQFSNTVTKDGVIQYCERYTGLGSTYISGDADKLLEFTAYSNSAVRKVWHQIFMATGCWEYDDKNATDLPQATTNLLSGQSKYALPSEALTVKRLEVKDSSGLWSVLTPLIRTEIKQAIDEFMDTDGTPRYYRVVGDTIELFPATDYDLAGGLKVYFDRGIVEFVSTDTTQEVGFDSVSSDLVPLYASYDWLSINLAGDPRTMQIEKKIMTWVEDLKNLYKRRFPDKKKVLRPRYQTFK